MDSIWELADICMVVLYLVTVVVAIRHLWRHRQDCLTCPHSQAWLRSSLLAFLVTPSVMSDFFLFGVPGPAALSFAVFLPGILFASGHRLGVLLLITVLYVLPWMACTVIIFYLWRFIRWWRLNRDHA